MNLLYKLLSKQRFRNVGLWIALTSLVLDILIYAGKINVSDKQEVEILVQRGLEILIGLGVLSNPTKQDGKGFNL